jgi:hypothetical protein
MTKSRLIVHITSDYLNWKISLKPSHLNTQLSHELLESKFLYQVIIAIETLWQDDYNIKFVLDGVTLDDPRIDKLRSDYIDYIFQD